MHPKLGKGSMDEELVGLLMKFFFFLFNFINAEFSSVADYAEVTSTQMV